MTRTMIPLLTLVLMFLACGFDIALGRDEVPLDAPAPPAASPGESPAVTPEPSAGPVDFSPPPSSTVPPAGPANSPAVPPASAIPQSFVPAVGNGNNSAPPTATSNNSAVRVPLPGSPAYFEFLRQRRQQLSTSGLPGGSAGIHQSVMSSPPVPSPTTAPTPATPTSELLERNVDVNATPPVQGRWRQNHPWMSEITVQVDGGLVRGTLGPHGEFQGHCREGQWLITWKRTDLQCAGRGELFLHPGGTELGMLWSIDPELSPGGLTGKGEWRFQRAEGSSSVEPDRAFDLDRKN